MILTEAQALARLNDPRNLLNREENSVHVKELRNGKVICRDGGGSVTKIGPITKKIIAAVAIESGDKKGTAEAFNLSRQAVTNISNAKSADGKKPDVEIKDFVEKRRESAAEIALTKTMEAFNLITGDKLSKASARDLASIAKDSASVYDKLSGRGVGAGAGVKINIYAPQIRDSKDYDVIEVGVEK